MLTEDLASRALDLRLAPAKPLTEIAIEAGSADTIRIPDAHLMFQGEYRKEGFDLVIEDENSRVVVSDYFRSGKRATLESPEGARLTDDVVAALAVSDHGLRYAQATPPAQQAAIGRVETVTGQATAIRNGTPVVLNQGDLVFKGDVVQTDRGSSLGITFVDGSSFSLASGARMVLNDMVYQPGGAQNSALLSIVQGSVTFLAGQVAKSGDMRVGTPVATMGIRGTLVNAEINANDGTTKFSVIREPNGEVGRYELIRDGRVIATVSAVDQVTTVSPTGVVTSEPKTFQQQQAEELLVQQVFQIFSLGQANPLIPGTGPTGPGPGGGGGGGGGSSTDPNLNDGTSPGPAPFGVPNPASPPLDNSPPPGNQTPQLQPIAFTGGSVLAGDTTETGAARVVFVRVAGGQSTVPVSDGEQATIVAGQYGDLAIRGDGTYVYVPTRTAPLAQGETGQDQFTYTSRSASGETSEVTLTFSNTGVNDAPTVSGPVSSPGLAEGSGTQAVDLLAGASDVDNGAVLHVENLRAEGTSPGSGLPAGFSLSSDGRTLIVDSDSPAYNDLGAGQTRSFTFTYDVVDEYGARVTQTATVVINGADEPPPAFDGSFETGFNGFDRLGETSTVSGGTTGSQAASITTSASTSVGYADIETFLGVPAGSLAQDESATHPNNASTIGSAIRTVSIRLEAGQSFRFDWNFSTNDYNPFNDFAVFTIDELDAIFELADVESVGNYGSTGWRTFTFTATKAGEYHFGFAVLDTGDGVVASTLLLDNVRVESNGAPLLTGAVSGLGTEGSGTFSLDLLAGASDPEGGALQVQGLDSHNSPGVSLPPGFSLAPDGHTLIVDSTNAAFDSIAQGQSRTYDFDYEVVDASGARTTQTASFTVDGTNDGPVAIADSRSATEDVSSTGNVVTNDSDPDNGATLTVTGIRRASDTSGSFTSSASGTYGQITINPDGSYSYTPNTAAAEALAAGVHGSDSFTYRITDEHGAPATATLTFDVTGANDAAVFTPSGSGTFTGSVTEAGAGSAGSPTASGSFAISDPDAGQGSATTVTGAESSGGYGTYSISSLGSATYTWTYNLDDGDPTVQALGQSDTLTDFFYITAADGTQQRIDIAITGSNDGPTATPNAQNVTEDATASGNVVTDGTPDSDPDSNDSIQVYGISRSSDASGTFTTSGSITSPYGHLTIGPDGTYSYAADGASAQALAQGATASDSFIYYIQDENGATTSSTLTFTVTGVNDAPTSPSGSFTTSTAEDTPTSGTLPAASDPDGGGTITYTLDSGASHGSASVYSAGSGTFGYSYTPAPDYEGPDSFTYTVSDGSASTTYTVSINVDAVNDSPVAIDNASEVAAGDTVSDPASVLSNDTDAEGDMLIVTGIRPGDEASQDNTSDDFYDPAIGSISGTYGYLNIAATGTYTYTAYSGTADGSQDSFTYRVSDGNGGEDFATLTFTITAPPPPPNTAPTITGVSSLQVVSLGTADLANGGANAATITPDGRYVAFASTGENLAPTGTDTNNTQDIFLKDTATGTLTRVSVEDDESQLTFASYNPSVSADGSLVAFQVGSNGGGYGNRLLIRDVLLGQTIEVPIQGLVESGGSPLVAQPKLSDDGQVLTFLLADANDAGRQPQAYVYDLLAGTFQAVPLPSGHINELGPQLNANGGLVAFDAFASATSSYDVFVANIAAGTTELTSVDSAETAYTGQNQLKDISADGNLVLFANDGSGNTAEGLYLRDRAAGETRFISTVDDVYGLASLSDDGRFVLFRTAAVLSPEDTDTAADDYIADLASGTAIYRLIHGENRNLSMSGDGLARAVGVFLESGTTQQTTEQVVIQRIGMSEFVDQTGSSTAHQLVGVIQFTDADANDRPTGTVTGQSYEFHDAAGQGLALTSQQEAALNAAFTLSADGNNTNSGTLYYSYQPTEADLDFLAERDVVLLTNHVEVTDGNFVASTDITLTIVGRNDAPIAAADAVSTDSTGFGSTVLANDFDVDRGDTFHVSALAGTFLSEPFPDGGSAQVVGNHGTLTMFSDGTYNYDVTSGSAGQTDTFTYGVSDGHGGTGEGSLTITLGSGPGGNAGLFLNRDQVLVARSGSIDIPASALLANDHGTGTDTELAITNVTSPATRSSDGFMVTVGTGGSGSTTSFTYTAEASPSHTDATSQVDVTTTLVGVPMVGTDADEILVGPMSGTTMTGGGGADVFVLAESGINTITDYQRGLDAIDFSFRFQTGNYAAGTGDVQFILTEDNGHLTLSAHNDTSNADDVVAQINLPVGEATTVHLVWQNHQQYIHYEIGA